MRSVNGAWVWRSLPPATWNSDGFDGLRHRATNCPVGLMTEVNAVERVNRGNRRQIEERDILAFRD